HSSQEARRLFSEAGLPTYRTPEGTITAFMHMVEYRRNQKQLRKTWPPKNKPRTGRGCDYRMRLINRSMRIRRKRRMSLRTFTG
ncbi:hypothetical protein, partial [Escherichia coli]|uniref:hypothetical protein n=1 Tax=Escherichia coli TaxID=562 RepID=UPI002302C0C6